MLHLPAIFKAPTLITPMLKTRFQKTFWLKAQLLEISKFKTTLYKRLLAGPVKKPSE